MSQMPDDGASKTSDIEHNVQHLVVSDIRSQNGATDKEKDFVASRKEKMSQESKKQAMGDSRNNDDDVKISTGNNVLAAINDNANNQKLPKAPKSDLKSKDIRKTVSSDDARRRGVFYAGNGRRGFLSQNCTDGDKTDETTAERVLSTRPIVYTSRGFWRPQSTAHNSGNNSQRSVPITSDDSVRKIGEKTRTNAASRNIAVMESSNIGNTYIYPFRPQMTRTFLNGALRGNRTWRVNNLTSRSQSHTVASEFSSQFSAQERIINSESTPHLRTSSAVLGSQNCEEFFSESNILSASCGGKFPIIYVSPDGIITILLDKGIVIEIAVDRAVHVYCHDKFSVVCNGRGNGSCILHPKTRIFQEDEKVFCNFGSTLESIEKAAVFGSQGVLFTMSHLNEAYLVSSTTIKGTLPVALGRLQFPSLDYDFTLRMFFSESQAGNQFTALCNDIVQEARYGTREDGSLTLTINGVYIKQDENGDVEVNCRPRYISCAPITGTVHVRTGMVDMAVQDNDKAFVKRGLKRVHVSRSGMVVSDGNCITSMDHFGHIVSST